MVAAFGYYGEHNNRDLFDQTYDTAYQAAMGGKKLKEVLDGLTQECRSIALSAFKQAQRDITDALQAEAEVEELAYMSGLAGASLAEVERKVPPSKQSDAQAYWMQGVRDRGRDAAMPPEMDAESREIAYACQQMESLGFCDVKVDKRWDFNRYKYAVSFNRGLGKIVTLERCDLDGIAATVDKFVADELSRRKVVNLFAVA